MATPLVFKWFFSTPVRNTRLSHSSCRQARSGEVEGCAEMLQKQLLLPLLADVQGGTTPRRKGHMVHYNH